MTAIIVLSDSDVPIAKQIKSEIGGTIQGFRPRVSDSDSNFESVGQHLQMLYKQGEPIVAVMASGALIRLLAPLLESKRTEPPVVCVASDGSSVVPLPGGHNGANDIARKLASALNGHAAVTTAGDVRFGIALDSPPEGWTLATPENAKAVMAEILAGEEVRLQGRYLNAASWLMESNLPLDDD